MSACVVAVPAFSLAQDKSPVMQTWTDSSGKIKTEAEFVKLEGVKLYLKKSDGKEVMVTLNRLDDKSRLRARSMAKRGTSNFDTGPTPVAGPPVEFPSNPSATEFKDIVVGEIKKNNFIVLWDALPANKQKQLEDLVKLASTKVEQRTLDQIKRFRTDLFGMLRSKKEFVLNSKSLMIPPEQRSKLEEAYDPFVEMLETMFSNDFLDAKNLQESNLRELMNNYLVEFVTKANAVERIMPSANDKRQIEALGDLKIESISPKEAMVSMPSDLPPGMLPIDKLKLVLVDGRWLPEPIAKDWDNHMRQVTQSIQTADPKALHRSVGQSLLLLTSFMGAFSLAETQEDFDEAISNVMGSAMSLTNMMKNGPQPPNGPGQPGRDQETPRRTKMPIAG
jgi:hypothetical protein